MRAQPDDIRCNACKILLAKTDRNGLRIVRNGLDASISNTSGETVVGLRCYRCGQLNTVHLSTPPRPTTAAA